MTEAEQKETAEKAPPAEFAPVVLPYAAIYEDIGLDPLGPGYSGRTIRVLVNPSVRFKRDFASAGWDATTAAGNVWMRHVATIFGATDHQALRDLISDMDPEVLDWLLIPHLVEDEFIKGKIAAVPAYICEAWDKWIEARVKARATRSKP